MYWASHVRLATLRVQIPYTPLACLSFTMSKQGRHTNRSHSKDVSTDTCSFHDFTTADIDNLRKCLLSWYDTDQRSLPWRKVNSSDINVKAYSVWVSEVMLQQTQVATVIEYYNRWMKEVNTMWSGLGYYSRGRSLLEGAQKVVRDMGGEMPQTAEDLHKILPGVGPYTAGAIASIACGQVTGLVDGNVMRVLSRLRLIGSYITQRNVVDKFWSLANAVVDTQRPGDFNQSVMELGATVCTPKTPACSRCPVKALCHAYTKMGHENHKIKSTALKSLTKSEKKFEIPDIENTVPDCRLCLPAEQNWDASLGVVNLPRKPPKAKAKQEDLYVLVIKTMSRKCDDERDQYWMVRRPDKGLLAGLWEFPVRSKSNQDSKKNLESVLLDEFDVDPKHAGTVMDCGQVTHMFSHIHHNYHVISLDAKKDWADSINETGLNPDLKDSRWISTDEMKDAAISTGMKKVLKMYQNPASLNPTKVSRKRQLEDNDKSQKNKKNQPSISNFFKPSKGKE